MKPFDIEDLEYYKDKNHPTQVVAFYLRCIDQNLISQVTLDYHLEALPEKEFRNIMRWNFMKGELITDRDSITYSQYSTWVKICYKLFTEF